MIKFGLKIIIIILIYSHNSIANDLNHQESYKLYNSGLIIIDVRNKSEWQETGIIPGSKLVQMLTPAMTLRNDFIDKLIDTIGNNKNVEVGIICKSGGRSSATVAMLKEKGYQNIYNISEGVVGNGENSGWISRGYPIIECEEQCN